MLPKPGFGHSAGSTKLGRPHGKNRYLEHPCHQYEYMQLWRNTLSTAGNSMTSSERPSPEPLLKERGVPIRIEGERILEMLWRPQMP